MLCMIWKLVFVSLRIKFVALFLLAFALFDVCTTEPCYAQSLSPSQAGVHLKAQHETANGDSCQFEEDCFVCAHYTPAALGFMQSFVAVSFVAPDLLTLALAGTPPLLYHPPRA